MQPKTFSRRKSRAAQELSRLGILIVALVTLVGLSLTLVGCSADEGPVEGVDGNRAVVDAWIQAANAEDVTQFEKLHTEDVVFHSHLEKSPSSGRANLWDAFIESNARPMQKIYMLAQDDFVCLQATASDPKRSFLYIFRLEGDSVAQVDEYTAAYDLSDVPLFDGAEITTDDSGLPARIDTIDSQVDAVNERDFLRFRETLHDEAIVYLSFTEAPVKDPEEFTDGEQRFTRSYPTIEWTRYRTFGQGNLVCQELALKNPIGAVGRVAVFEEGKISRLYSYYSDALFRDVLFSR